MLTDLNSSVFTDSQSINMVPVVSAEWNYNLFFAPYITTAGEGERMSGTPTSEYANATIAESKENFITKKFTMSNGSGSASYTVSGLSGTAYKVVTYIKTNTSTPVMINTSNRGSSSQYGSEQVEVSSLGWTKVITYIGASKLTTSTTIPTGEGYFASFCSEGVAISDGGPQYTSVGQLEAWINANYTSVSNITYNEGSAPPLPNCSSGQNPTPTETSIDTINSFVYKIVANNFSSTDTDSIIYFTEPEIYRTTLYDYKYGSLWPTDSPFTYFRPGESYVSSGNNKCSFPANYRKINSSVLSGYSTATYSPISPIIQHPQFSFASPPVPVLKSSLPTDIAPYKYFVSDSDSKNISAAYEKSLLVNKIIIKVNSLISKPTLKIYLNGSSTPITVGSSTSITTDSTGLLSLYWTGSAWTKTKWDSTTTPSQMPKFGLEGEIAKATSISKIRVEQVGKTLNSEFTSYSSDSFLEDVERMQIVEISPRLEVDLSDFVQDVSISKSIDGDNTLLPISSLNSNDARITLSGIPAMKNNVAVPIFSSQSGDTLTVLSGLLRKNVKFYINFNLISYSGIGNSQVVNEYVPGGVFYADDWNENDIQDVTVQCYDISRYLQFTPVPDYVANLKSIFEIITNILDLAGFTDYDFDSLYKICNNKSYPMDISYFYCNSQDTTIVKALNEIFVAYQIGAYIDEYGIMKFLSLYDILSSTTSNISISDSSISQGGLSVTNKAKPGKISLRYQTPKVKQSPSLQNVTDNDIKTSPAFIYTTSNDVVWQQQTIDSVGFNYLSEDMDQDSNRFTLNISDLLDIFHTFNLDNNGYAAIEQEIVSFEYKEYTLSKKDGTMPYNVSVKNNIELSSEINQYIKSNSIGLKDISAVVTSAYSDETEITFIANNDFSVGQRVSISGVVPSSYNGIGIVSRATITDFSVSSVANPIGVVTKSGIAIVAADYDIKVTPTGDITNVQRGMFGTVASDHSIITSLQDKGLVEKKIDSSFVFSDNDSGLSNAFITTNHDDPTNIKLPDVTKIGLRCEGTNKTVVMPALETNRKYKTYSVKFDLLDQPLVAAGLFFNYSSQESLKTIFVELIRYNTIDPSTGFLYVVPNYRYHLVIYDETGLYAKTDVTGEVLSIINSFPKIITKTDNGGKWAYSYVSDKVFNLKVVINTSDGSDGENGTEDNNSTVISVFLNNVEINGWEVPIFENNQFVKWDTAKINQLTGVRQKPSIFAVYEESKNFGFYTTVAPYELGDIEYPEPLLFINVSANLREIHATEKPLFERSVNYFYQDREFLNGLVQGQRLSLNSLTYLMQTTPSVSGINYYDVQYTTPAAVSVDILPVQYMMYYFPGIEPSDQKNYQKKLVNEYSISYSTPINTGFRAKMAIANNSPNMVLLTKEADEIVRVSVNLNLWTHEIVAPSDPEVIEKIIDSSNMSESIQIDSEWIQSSSAANKMLKVIEMGLESFSRQVSIDIFGNPLIQIGDVVNLTYPLKGIANQKYFISAVEQSFSEGLSTRLTMNRLQ